MKLKIEFGKASSFVMNLAGEFLKDTVILFYVAVIVHLIEKAVGKLRKLIK